MPKLLPIVLLLAVVAGGFYFFANYEIRRQDDAFVISPRGNSPEAESIASLPVASGRNSIRIATFHLGPLDRKKLGNTLVAGHLIELIREFDIVAVQDIRDRNEGILRALVERINSAGRHYDFAVSPDVGREAVDQYSAFLFDKASIQIDRGTICSVDDPAGRFRHKPLAALFCTRAADPAEAFTFALINVHTAPDQTDAELDLLDDVYRAVRQANPKEDDVIVLGNLEADERHLGQLGEVPNLTPAVRDTISTTRGTRLADNLLFDRRATSEFTGRSGVVDLMRRLNLSMSDAMSVAEHMPVWAEFSIYEGGQAGQIASGPRNSPE